jgi:hypothetical protein
MYSALAERRYWVTLPAIVQGANMNIHLLLERIPAPYKRPDLPLAATTEESHSPAATAQQDGPAVPTLPARLHRLGVSP